jgi:hypothetical protein
MFSRLLLVLLVVTGCGQPRAWMEAERLEGTRPEWVVLRCRISGFPARPRFSWKLPPGVHPISTSQPLDEGALLVQLNDNLRSSEVVECTAGSDKDPPTATAQLALGPCTPASAKIAAGQLIVDGNGFGDKGAADAVWLVPARGRALRADHACKGASWTETHIVACLPKLAAKSYQVRVESAGRLALGPLVTVP